MHNASVFLPFWPPIHFDGGSVDWIFASVAADGVLHFQETLPSNRLNVAEELAVLVAIPRGED